MQPVADRKVGRPHCAGGGNAGAFAGTESKGLPALPAFQCCHPSAHLLGTGRGQQADGRCLISAEAKLLKPDPQIYRTFLRKFALRPEECVFIDDTPINVEGALYENMAGIVFNMDVPALAESLCTLGVEW